MTDKRESELVFRQNLAIILACAVVITVLLLDFAADLDKVDIIIIQALLYCALFMTYDSTFKQTVVSPLIKSALRLMMVLSILSVITMAGQVILSEINYSSSLLFYLSYLPEIAIPLLGMIIVINLNQASTKGYRPLIMLGIPAVALFILLLTNNYHHLFFYTKTFYNNQIVSYEYNSGFWILTGWTVAISVYAMVYMYISRRVFSRRTFSWLPILAFVVWLCYLYAKIKAGPNSRILGSNIDCLFCAGNLFLWAAALKTGLVPSNKNYKELLENSSLAVQIVNDDYKTLYSSATAVHIDRQTMIAAENGTVDLGNNIRLRSQPVSGGHVIWLENVKAINEVLDALEQNGAVTSRHNEIIRAETALKSRQIRVNEQNRLYAIIEKSIMRPLKDLEILLGELDNDKYDTNTILGTICVISAYIKRRSNLVLVSVNKKKMASGELAMCLQESLENVKTLNVDVSYLPQAEGMMASGNIMLMYDLFEEVLEQLLADVRYLDVALAGSGSKVVLTITADSQVQLNAVENGVRIEKAKGKMAIRHDNGNVIIQITLPR